MRKTPKIKDTSCSCDDSCCDGEKALFQITKEPLVRVRHNPRRAEAGNCSTGSCDSTSSSGQLNFVFVKPQFDLYYKKNISVSAKTNVCGCNENNENLTINYYYKFVPNNYVNNNSFNISNTVSQSQTNLKEHLIILSTILDSNSSMFTDSREVSEYLRNIAPIFKDKWAQTGVYPFIISAVFIPGYKGTQNPQNPTDTKDTAYLHCFPCDQPGCCGNSRSDFPFCNFGCCLIRSYVCKLHDKICIECEPRWFCLDCIVGSA